jgi:hypothetical protein
VSPGPFDAGIPVLTEVLREVPPPAPPAPAPAVSGHRPAVWRTGAGPAATGPVPAPAPVIDLVVPAEADVEAGMAAEADNEAEAVKEADPAREAAAPVAAAAGGDLAALEQALSERIVRQLMPRVDALVAERLDQVLRHLAADLQAGLGESIAQAVAASVRQELAALQAPQE